MSARTRSAMRHESRCSDAPCPRRPAPRWIVAGRRPRVRIEARVAHVADPIAPGFSISLFISAWMSIFGDAVSPPKSGQQAVQRGVERRRPRSWPELRRVGCPGATSRGVFSSGTMLKTTKFSIPASPSASIPPATAWAARPPSRPDAGGRGPHGAEEVVDPDPERGHRPVAEQRRGARGLERVDLRRRSGTCSPSNWVSTLVTACAEGIGVVLGVEALRRRSRGDVVRPDRAVRDAALEVGRRRHARADVALVSAKRLPLSVRLSPKKTTPL